MLFRKLAIAAASLGLTGAAPPPQQVLAPAGKWNVHFGDNSCKLIRQFGDPAKPTTLMMERIAPGANLSLLVTGPLLRSRTDDGIAKAAFLPFEDHEFSSGKIAETRSDKSSAILWTNVDFLDGWKKEPREYKRQKDVKPLDPVEVAARKALIAANSAKVSGLLIIEPNRRRSLLQTGSMQRVHELMERCARDQLTDWGLDPDVQDKIVLPAASSRSLASYFSSNDYPPAAFRNGEEAVISARLIVGADGRVRQCTSLTLFKAEEMAQAVCRNLERATFRPAELADGTKVPTFVTATVNFRM
ncbi:hypothetical protein GGQ97_000772 [Sphingomonas kaistensis]|uniref:TonB C-terminal domain-containing protein n=1 Tax=Sphingomonas kaistensis TaxID=298708 RepID=A0A7X5Y4D6_9SPHN|nr:energy transducer TonB [Sphingomonas kaistensis]NJC04979.1 hypothetical protein [Sphingomonas kaistensis]